MMNRISIYSLLLIALLTGCDSMPECSEQEAENKELLGFCAQMESSTPISRSEGDSVQQVTCSDTICVAEDIYMMAETKDWKASPATRGIPMMSSSDLSSIRINRFQGTWSTSLGTNPIDATKSGTVFSYKPPYTWLINSTLQSFLAYSPIPAAGDGITEQIGGKTLTYEVPTADITKHPDICVSKFSDQMNIENTGSGEHMRTLTFRHVLTGIGFSIRGYKVQVKEVSISGVKTKGTFDLTDDAGTWTLDPAINKDPQTAGITQTDWNVRWTSSWTNITTSNGYFMMLPQELTDDAQLKVVYVYKEGEEKGVEQSFTTNLKKLTGGTWKQGTLVTYNIRLKTTPVVASDVTINHFLKGYTSQAVPFTDLANDDNITFEWKESWLKIYRGSPTYGSMPAGSGSGWTTGTGGPWSNIYFYSTEDNRSTTSSRSATVTVRGVKSADRTFKVIQSMSPVLNVDKTWVNVVDYKSKPWENGQLNVIGYTTNYPQYVQIKSSAGWVRPWVSNGRIIFDYDWNIQAEIDRQATITISIVANGFTFISKTITINQRASSYWIMLWDDNVSFRLALSKDNGGRYYAREPHRCWNAGLGTNVIGLNEVYDVLTAVKNGRWVNYANFEAGGTEYWTNTTGGGAAGRLQHLYRIDGSFPNISWGTWRQGWNGNRVYRCATWDRNYIRRK